MASNYFLFTKTITENLTAPHPTEASSDGCRTERSLSVGFLQKKKKNWISMYCYDKYREIKLNKLILLAY